MQYITRPQSFASKWSRSTFLGRLMALRNIFNSLFFQSCFSSLWKIKESFNRKLFVIIINFFLVKYIIVFFLLTPGSSCSRRCSPLLRWNQEWPIRSWWLSSSILWWEMGLYTSSRDTRNLESPEGWPRLENSSNPLKWGSQSFFGLRQGSGPEDGVLVVLKFFYSSRDICIPSRIGGLGDYP